jgi:hypothetical protein
MSRERLQHTPLMTLISQPGSHASGRLDRTMIVFMDPNNPIDRLCAELMKLEMTGLVVDESGNAAIAGR